MRTLILAAAALLAACASGGAEPDAADASSPFPVERGSALPPPQAQGQAAPPEGAADPTQYAAQFQAQVRQRFAGQNATQLRMSLEANGFACEDHQRLDCRIEIMERQCAFDWYVVLERGDREPVAGFDQMCLGAR